MGNEELPPEVMERVQRVFREVFDDDTLEITLETSAENVPDWDSLMHITLCIALEREFGIRLNAVEIAGLSNVGKLAERINQRCTGK